jgi:hypothetical protein
MESILVTNRGGDNIILLSLPKDPLLLLSSLFKSLKSSSATIIYNIPFLYISLNLCSIVRILGLIGIVVNISGLSDFTRLASCFRRANSLYNPMPLI